MVPDFTSIHGIPAGTELADESYTAGEIKPGAVESESAEAVERVRRR